MIWENSIETGILPYVNKMTSASLMHVAEHPKLVLWDNPKGYGGEGDERGGWDVGDTCIPVANSCWCMTKNHHNILKYLFSNQNK